MCWTQKTQHMAHTAAALGSEGLAGSSHVHQCELHGLFIVYHTILQLKEFGKDNIEFVFSTE